MLALIAGRGRLPAVLVDSLAERPYVASPVDHDPDFLVPDRRFRIEELGTLIGDLKATGVTEVCFAGAVRRPAVDQSRIDAATAPLISRITAALEKGDDGALREVIAIFEEAGFRIRAADELAGSLLPPTGFLSARRPDPQHERDAARGTEVLRSLGRLDIGQACAVHRGQVLAVEGSFGTDWMLASLRNRPDGGGGVFCKAAKPGQDRRIDLPVVGVDTVTAAKEAGLDGIAVEGGSVMVLDATAVARAADRTGLFFWVREP